MLIACICGGAGEVFIIACLCGLFLGLRNLIRRIRGKEPIKRKCKHEKNKSFI